jgi:hypothetical protein
MCLLIFNVSSGPAGQVENRPERRESRRVEGFGDASVDTSKPATRGQVKTGHHGLWRPETELIDVSYLCRLATIILAGS